jgi:hypothetical protein
MSAEEFKLGFEAWIFQNFDISKLSSGQFDELQL